MSGDPDTGGDTRRLQQAVQDQARRLAEAERERSTLLAQTVYLGTLALLLVLPLIGGAYLGLWLDERQAGYSVHWTIGGLVLGLALGVVNVWVYVRQQAD